MWTGRSQGGTPAMSLPIKKDAARGRFLEPGKHAQQRGLAAARSAQKGEDLALADGQGHILDRLKRAKAFRDAFDPQEGFFRSAMGQPPVLISVQARVRSRSSCSAVCGFGV
jgi:hypothetical protein